MGVTVCFGHAGPDDLDRNVHSRANKKARRVANAIGFSESQALELAVGAGAFAKDVIRYYDVD